jgi:hypothetical protein
MARRHPDHEKLFRVAALCQNAIQAQRDRERRLGYGVDDYTEGRIVGAADLARTILRTLVAHQTDGPWQRPRPRNASAG